MIFPTMVEITQFISFLTRWIFSPKFSFSFISFSNFYRRMNEFTFYYFTHHFSMYMKSFLFTHSRLNCCFHYTPYRLWIIHVGYSYNIFVKFFSDTRHVNLMEIVYFKESLDCLPKLDSNVRRQLVVVRNILRTIFTTLLKNSLKMIQCYVIWRPTIHHFKFKKKLNALAVISISTHRLLKLTSKICMLFTCWLSKWSRYDKILNH